MRKRRLRLAVGELGETERAIPDHRDDRFVLRRGCGCSAHLFEPTEVGVDVRAPDADTARCHPLLLEREDQLVAELGSALPVTGPGLEDELVEQDVRERRFVALVACLLLGRLELCTRSLEVVHVAKPLPELEADAAVDRRRRALRLERGGPLRGLAIEALAEKE